MTKLLEQAMTKIQTLPDDTQDAIATRLLAELSDELQWDAQFAATTESQWDRLAELARQEIAAGETIPLNDLFEDQVPNK